MYTKKSWSNKNLWRVYFLACSDSITCLIAYDIARWSWSETTKYLSIRVANSDTMEENKSPDKLLYPFNHGITTRVNLQ